MSGVVGRANSARKEVPTESEVPLTAVVLTAMVVLSAPAATAQVATEDSVTGRATGGPGFFGDIQLDVRSGPSGENPSGTAFFRIAGDRAPASAVSDLPRCQREYGNPGR